MNTFLGVPIIESELAVKVVERRVRGGYMNHWLIRAHVREPSMLVDRRNNRIYVHPALMPALRAKLNEQIPAFTERPWF